MITTPSGWVPVGRAYFEDKMSAAVELTDTPDGGDALPATANCAIIYVSGQPIYWETDGTAAITSQPKYPVSNFLVIDNSRDILVKSSFLETGASARLDCWYFLSPAG